VGYEREYEELAAFHGCRCPEIALGVRFVMAARSHLTAAPDVPLLVHSEGTGCLVDALQHLTGATVGNGRLVHHNYGKLAAVFWLAGTGPGIRVRAAERNPAYLEPDVWDAAHQQHSFPSSPRFDRDMIQSTVTAILNAAPQDLLDLQEIPVPAADEVPLVRFEPCTKCKEMVRRHRLFNHDGIRMCDPCHLASHGGTLPAIHPRDPIPS
jgi:formylmethanofuran dehydrogenase subunit E